jgi:hypothetical protein
LFILLSFPLFGRVCLLCCPIRAFLMMMPCLVPASSASSTGSREEEGESACGWMHGCVGIHICCVSFSSFCFARPVSWFVRPFHHHHHGPSRYPPFRRPLGITSTTRTSSHRAQRRRGFFFPPGFLLIRSDSSCRGKKSRSDGGGTSSIPLHLASAYPSVQ